MLTLRRRRRHLLLITNPVPLPVVVAILPAGQARQLRLYVQLAAQQLPGLELRVVEAQDGILDLRSAWANGVRLESYLGGP